MTGFKKFLMRGNLVEVAVAFIIGAVFGEVVKSFTQLILDVLAKVIGGKPDFSAVELGGVNVGVFITATITFVITAAAVYFGVVVPYTKLRERFTKPAVEAAAPTSEELLVEIRDILASQAK